MSGLEIKNNNGSVMISPDNKLLVMSERGTFKVTSAYTDRPGYGTVVFKRPIRTTTTPSVFVRYVTGNFSFFSCYFRFTGSPGNWTGFTVVSGVSGGSALQDHTLEYVSCKYVDTLNTMNAGLQLFDEQGNVIFDSGYKPVKYSKMTREWQFTYPEQWYIEMKSNVPIANDDFICVSQMDRGPVFLDVSAQFVALSLKKNNVLELNIDVQILFQGYTWNSAQGNPIFCMPICKFPVSVYPPD